jgi:tRNA dimethylallyltransferase
MKTLVVIAGPTGVGKTKTGIRVAQHFNTEIISADSRQIFMETKIGTAVPSNEELSLAKHHLIQTRHITEYYNAWMFEQDALVIADEIFKTHDVALLVGGSGLYIDAVCNGIDEIPDIEPELRAKVNEQYLNEGIESLRQTLKFLDPDYYEIVDIQNPVRLKRAIEICIQAGKPYSQLRKEQSRERPFRIIKLALNLPREELYERINRRVDEMVAAGLEDEVRSLIPQKECMALKTVGDREFFDYFDNLTSKEEAIEKIKQNTRKYAKKQISWLKRDADVQWFSPFEDEKIIAYIEEKLS